MSFNNVRYLFTVRLGILLTFFLWECTTNFAATSLCIPHSALLACDAYVDALCIKMSCPNTAD